MDNTKTGAFIKALRTEKDLTQRELAERLHITNQAVSKWERGLSAPDIALLEPLAGILDVSVVELIRGERIPEEEHTPAMEKHTRDLLAYSGEEAKRRERSARKTAVLVTAGLVLLAVLWGWRTGAFFLLDDCPSPDGTAHIKVYSKERNGGWFTLRDRITLTYGPAITNCYGLGDCMYKGLWWSPDSKRYVLALDYGGHTELYLGRGTNTGYLNGYLEDAVQASRLAGYGISWKIGNPWPTMAEYEFVQWGPDGNTMLIWYSFTGDHDGLEHSGYFWFDCELMCLSGLFELDAEREPDSSFTPWGPFRPTAS